MFKVNILYIINIYNYTRFFRVTLLGGVFIRDFLQGLSDLHLGDQRVTWKMLACKLSH